jgi:hypothetical protein
MKSLIIILILGLVIYGLTKAMVGAGRSSRRRGPRGRGGTSCGSSCGGGGGD